MATLTAQTVAASQQQAQQQQQQQLHNANSNSNSTSSTSPLSNSSTNSSSCLTTNSFSSPSSYSPIQQQQQQQQLQQQQQQQTATVAHLYTTANGMGTNGQIILTIPVQHQQHAQGQPPMNNLVSIASNNGAPVTNVQTVGENGTPGGGGGSYVGVINTCSSPNLIYNSNKPEAKKVKIQKSQPSKVVHVRNIPQQITEVEIIQFGLIFGNIINVLNLRSKCQVRKIQSFRRPFFKSIEFFFCKIL